MRNYRAKRKDNGEWVYGWYLKHSYKNETDKKDTIIQDEAPYEVIPETVGQNIGLEDKMGVAIYKGDRVLDEKLGVAEIKFINASFVVYNAKSQHWVVGAARASRMLVVGNIHDTPNLLEGKE